jgi:3-methyl-2-oxobutanoate hydroxymethyltransferase
VIGHVGLTPQAVNALGGYRARGRDEAEAAKILADARRSRRPAASRWCSKA